MFGGGKKNQQKSYTKITYKLDLFSISLYQLVKFDEACKLMCVPLKNIKSLHVIFVFDFCWFFFSTAKHYRNYGRYSPLIFEALKYFKSEREVKIASSFSAWRVFCVLIASFSVLSLSVTYFSNNFFNFEIISSISST